MSAIDKRYGCPINFIDQINILGAMECTCATSLPVLLFRKHLIPYTKLQSEKTRRMRVVLELPLSLTTQVQVS